MGNPSSLRSRFSSEKTPAMRTRENYRIGILGGMGPSAGVLLQQLIIEATPANKDQDHIQVVCFTNPQIPDRTVSLKENDGKKFVAAISESIKILEKAGVDVLVLPCNTSHARLREIQKETILPIMDMVNLTVLSLQSRGFDTKKIGVLATNGSVTENVYQNSLAKYNLLPVLPSPVFQEKLMKLIYAIKSGINSSFALDGLEKIICHLTNSGAEIIILGCTELSLYAKELRKKGHPIVDPLLIVAQELVRVIPRSKQITETLSSMTVTRQK
jgi:aspartate racemase